MVLGRPKGAQVEKGKFSAYKTIQLLTGKAPDFLINIDSGNQDIEVFRPTRKPGKRGAYKSKLDRGQKTTGNIQLKGVR